MPLGGLRSCRVGWICFVAGCCKSRFASVCSFRKMFVVIFGFACTMVQPWSQPTNNRLKMTSIFLWDIKFYYTVPYHSHIETVLLVNFVGCWSLISNVYHSFYASASQNGLAKVVHYQTCEQDILKVNETMSVQIGTSGLWEMINFWSQRSRSHGTKK